MARPRKANKKEPISFRVPPVLALQINSFALALGTSLSEALEEALEAFFEAGMAEELIRRRQLERDAAVADLQAQAEAMRRFHDLNPRAQELVIGHLTGLRYAELLGSGDLSEREARALVKEARASLGPESWATLEESPELVDRLRRALLRAQGAVGWNLPTPR